VHPLALLSFHLHTRKARFTLCLSELSVHLAACMAYSSIMKMEAVRSFETSMNFYRTTRRHITEIPLFIVTAVRISDPNN
jgi:hypothetical protein